MLPHKYSIAMLMRNDENGNSRPQIIAAQSVTESSRKSRNAKRNITGQRLASWSCLPKIIVSIFGSYLHLPTYDSDK